MKRSRVRRPKRSVEPPHLGEARAIRPSRASIVRGAHASILASVVAVLSLTEMGCAHAATAAEGKVLPGEGHVGTNTRMVTCRSVSMPERMTDSETTLVLNGMAVKRVTVFGIAVFVGA